MLFISAFRNKAIRFKATRHNRKEQMTNVLLEPLLDRKMAAKLLNVSPGTLAVWDSTKRYNLQPLRAGNRVRYRRSVLEDFLNRQVQPAHERQAGNIL
ncbi:MAG: helix-turn-helix domain-containing protein [Bacteroidota bacterium]